MEPSIELPKSWERTPLDPFGVLVVAGGGPPLESWPADKWRALLRTERLVVLRGFQPMATQEQFSASIAGWGKLLEWDFGTVFEVTQHAEPDNYLFTSGSVPFHWDGAFAELVPWLQVFHCLESPEGGGGETTFCDTTAVWRCASPETQELWRGVEITYSTEKVAHYGGRVRVPLVGRHPITNSPTLRFAEPPDAATAPLNTPELEVHGLSMAPATFLADLKVSLYDPRQVYAHRWEAGDYLVADNHCFLHGRRPYETAEPRKLWRVHVIDGCV